MHQQEKTMVIKIIKKTFIHLKSFFTKGGKHQLSILLINPPVTLNDPTNFCPISLLSFLYESIERVIGSQLNDFFTGKQ